MKNDNHADNIYEDLKIQLDARIDEINSTLEALEKAHLTIDSLYNNDIAAIVLVDCNGIINDCNKLFSNFTGRSRNEILNKSLAQFIYDADKNTFLSVFKAFFKKPENKRYTFRFSGAKGPEDFMYASLRGSRTILQGLPYFHVLDSRLNQPKDLVFILITNIDNYMQTKAALEQSNVKFDCIFDAADNGIAAVDSNDMIFKINRAGREILGLPQKEGILRKNFFSLLRVTRESLFTMTAQSQTARIHYTPPNQHIIKVLDIRVHEFIDSKGNPDRVFTINDVTDLIRQEDEIIKLQRLEAVGKLASGIAHDLNNLLAPVLGYSDMLMNDEISGEEKMVYYSEIHDSAFKCKELLEHLLVFGRKKQLKMKNHDFRDIYNDFKGFIKSSVPEKITVEEDITSNECFITGDSVHLSRVIMNLVINSINSIEDKGTIKIGIHKRKIDKSLLESLFILPAPSFKPGDFVVLEITDTGRGMDQKTADHIFEPFYTSDSKKGTGLGMSAVYGIVKEHHGEIKIKTSPGLGTSVMVFLPCLKKEEPEGFISDALLSNKPKVKTGSRPQDRKGCILLVEDSSEVRRMTEKILLSKGYRVITAENGTQGLELYQAGHDNIDLVLTDLVMPLMDGIELYENLKNIKEDVKCIFMSGYALDIVDSKGILKEKENFISKPYRIKELIELVDKNF
jgi:PAS domain S-box-containing protein